ncbi:MAG: guanine deaminase [Candidatus Solibacter sp.]|nr:guanine deaminase [Candidatus Solibacter sp.]
MTSEILRAALFHVPRNPFRTPGSLAFHEDAGLLIANGRIAACGDYASVRQSHPDVAVRDLRGGVLLPGFIDTHIHFPQVRILGCLGHGLLEWLQRYTLPEEAKFADVDYARTIANEFVCGLAAHGTTTALVFGSHFAASTAALFEAAQAAGLRIVAGMVLSDRMLLPELHQSPEKAYRDSTRLIRDFHGTGRLLYAVTPRFALSCSDAILEVCGALLRENPGVRFQTHLNESRAEVKEVARLFPRDADYLAVYERHGLAGRHSVFAHNVQTTDAELERMAANRCSTSHCPGSNAALGSGILPMRRHLARGVHFALGTDVGGGIGFGMLKEGLQAYLLQRLTPDGFPLAAEHLLYLATLAGAEALGLERETGDFSEGKSADVVYVRAPRNSSLAAVMRNAPSAEHLLSAIFTVADASCIEQVWVEGRPVKI